MGLLGLRTERSGLGIDLGIPLSCWYELDHLMTVD